MSVFSVMEVEAASAEHENAGNAGKGHSCR